MKKLLLLITLTLSVLFVGCVEQQRPPKPKADAIMQKRTEVAMREAERQTGFPAIKNFQEKKIMKMIYELRDTEGMICYAYLVNRNTGRVGQFLGKSIGYGLPYATQFSNPEKIVVNRIFSQSAIYGTLPQPEPNGLFMPEGLSATWLLLIDPKTNKPRPVYVEPEIIVSPFPLK